ncbi:5-formyltetrahydrofolate cyclo-ligase [Trifolium repens]|nr:5-formyltetrahydrofolate cyclo-ligase [Trifolium repens]
MFLTREATKSKASFNEVAFEAEWLNLNTEARQAMVVEEEESYLKDDRKACKLVIRQRIWDLLEGNNFAQNPRHVHHRIPNFVLLLTS